MEKKQMGDFIAKLRKEKGWTQKELAEKLFISDKAVSKWERNLSYPDISLLDPLSEILEVSVSELLNGERLETLTKETASPIIKKGIQMYLKQISKKIGVKIGIGCFMVIGILLFLLLIISELNYGEIILNDKTILELPNISSRLEKRTADKFMKAFQEKDIDTIKEILLPNHEWVHFHPTDISNETTFIFREAYENHSLEELANDFYEYVEVLYYQYERTHYSSLEYTFSYIVHLKIKEEEIEMGMKLNGNKKYLTFGSYSYIHTESIKRVQENYPEIWQKILFFLCW